MLPWGSSSIRQSKLPCCILSKARFNSNLLKSTFDKDCIQISFTSAHYSTFLCNIPFSFVCKISSGVLSIVTFSFLPSLYGVSGVAHRDDLCIYQLALCVDLLSINKETGTVMYYRCCTLMMLLTDGGGGGAGYSLWRWLLAGVAHRCY